MGGGCFGFEGFFLLRVGTIKLPELSIGTGCLGLGLAFPCVSGPRTGFGFDSEVFFPTGEEEGMFRLVYTAFMVVLDPYDIIRLTPDKIDLAL